MNRNHLVLVSAALAALALTGLTSALTEARVFKGTKKANKVVGTKKADTIRLGAGNDRARGRGGNDRIDGGAGKDRLSGDAGGDRVNGGAGNDNLAGGKGRDRLSGGAGNDVINAADGRRDASINGGKGRNRCKLDQADVAIARGCGSISVKPGTGGGGAPGGGGGPGDPGRGGSGGGAGLVLEGADGLQCASELPTCQFTLDGSGADSLVGTVTGVDGVTALGAGVIVTPEEGLEPSESPWTAAGTYGCTKDGYLRVTIGSETLDVPVDCTVEP
jgi:Ca2+-binding RTX toxin-like protein